MSDVKGLKIPHLLDFWNIILKCQSGNPRFGFLYIFFYFNFQQFSGSSYNGVHKLGQMSSCDSTHKWKETRVENSMMEQGAVSSPDFLFFSTLCVAFFILFGKQIEICPTEKKTHSLQRIRLYPGAKARLYTVNKIQCFLLL